jgi:hypothetical protein
MNICNHVIKNHDRDEGKVVMFSIRFTLARKKTLLSANENSITLIEVYLLTNINHNYVISSINADSIL